MLYTREVGALQREAAQACSAMATLETYASQTTHKVHFDVLSEARHACYKVSSPCSSTLSLLFLGKFS